MASPADLVVRILADTSSAQTNVNTLIETLGKMAGVGAGAAVAGGITTSAMDFQSAFAQMQSAVNSVDFAPGTKKFEDAKTQIVDYSTTLATSADDVSKVYTQALKFMDDAGQHLSTDKLNEYTDTMVRLSKVSTDNLAATDIGQQMDVFEKLYGQQAGTQGGTNFAQVGSELSALSGVHNQGESVTMAAAIPIAQYGAEMGVSQEQALGVATYLADRGAGGGMAGASIGRMFQRMDASANSVLDPTESLTAEKKARTEQERIDDLQTQIKEAEARHAQMYGQHGLKRQYQRDPAAVMVEEDRIAKLQRDLADAQHDQAAQAQADKTPARGKMDVAAMANIVGMDATDYANLVKTNPMDALIAFTTALSNIAPQDRQAAEAKAGFTNVRDIKTADVLAAEPQVLQSYIDLATKQKDNPTDLASRSQINLDTTAAKVTDVGNAVKAEAAAAGEGPRQAIDALTQQALTAYHDNTSAIQTLNTTLSGNPLLGVITTGVVSGVTAVIPSLVTSLLVSKAATSATSGVAAATGASAASGAASTVTAAAAPAAPVTAAAAGTTIGEGAAVGAATLAPFALADAWKTQHPDSSFKQIDDSGKAYAEHHPIGSVPQSDNPQSINIGGVTVNVPGGKMPDWSSVKDDLLNTFSQQIEAAWIEASRHEPISGMLGGNLNASGQGPH